MELMEAVTIAKNCIATNELIPILTHIYIDNGCIYTSNGAQFVKIKVPQLEGVTGLIEGDLFYRLIKSLPVENLTFTCENNKFTITAGRRGHTAAKLMSRDVEEFTPFTDVLQTRRRRNDINTTDIVVDQQFVQGLTQCLTSVDDRSDDVSTVGVAMKVSSNIDLYSTNRVLLSKVHMVDRGSKSSNIYVLLPKILCQLLISTKDKIDGSTLKVSDNSASLVTQDEEIIIYSKLPQDIEFPEFDSVLETYYTRNTTFIDTTNRVKEALDRCMLLYRSGERKKINVTMSASSLRFESRNQSGNIQEIIKIKGGNELKLIIDGEMMKSSLALCSNFNFISRKREGKDAPVFIGIDDIFTRLLATVTSDVNDKEE